MTTDVLLTWLGRNCPVRVARTRFRSDPDYEDDTKDLPWIPLEPELIAVWHMGGDMRLSRVQDGTAFLLNLGYKPLRLSYYVKDKALPVGPKHEYLMPQQFRELGLGPGIEWVVSETIS